jgi:hypothetical protein
MDTTFDLDFDLATPPPQTPEERAQRMLERARSGLQVNQQQYEKARRRQRWDRVADSLGRIERAEQAIRHWQQELVRIRSSRGPYRFEDEMDTLLDDTTYLERGVHGHFPFSRSMYGRRGYARPTARGPISRFADDDLDAMIDEAGRSRSSVNVCSQRFGRLSTLLIALTNHLHNGQIDAARPLLYCAPDVIRRFLLRRREAFGNIGNRIRNARTNARASHAERLVASRTELRQTIRDDLRPVMNLLRRRLPALLEEQLRDLNRNLEDAIRQIHPEGRTINTRAFENALNQADRILPQALLTVRNLTLSQQNEVLNYLADASRATANRSTGSPGAVAASTNALNHIRAARNALGL